ncbi:MAG: hypothetical protein ABL994_23495, partial [Verrucomicrobiales bacterium]
SYVAYFESGLDFLDPHLRFLDFLKLQEGPAGARESYQLIVERSKSIIPRYASILLWERQERIPKLLQFVTEHPDFAPAYYQLSEEYSEARLGTRSLDDKRLEKEYLEKFLKLSAEGKFIRWFIDRSMVSDWQQKAESRLTALKTSVSDTIMANPVELRWMSTNGGWMGVISIAEPTLEIFWKGPGMEGFKSTGPSPTRDPRTGKPLPNMTITLPENTAKADFQVKYTNASGAEMGPFTLPFDPAESTLVESKNTLELTRTSWVAFRDYEGKVLLYFSHLLGHRGVLRQIQYGLDRDIPDTVYAFPPYDKPGYAPISDDVTIYMEVPAPTKFVTVKLTFRDGTTSDVVRFDR